MPSDSDADEGPSCIICLGPALHPVRLTCECKFVGCADCLYRWLHSKPHTYLRNNFAAGTCPTCRKVGVEPILVDFETGKTIPMTVGEMAKLGELEQVKLMISLGANWFQSDEYGVTPLVAAAGAGQLSSVKMLLEQNAWCVDYRSSPDHPTALFAACENGHADVAEFLLLMGADINESDGFCTPFSIAAAKGHLNILELLNRTVGFNIEKCVDEFGTTPLHEAATHGHLHCLQFLLDPASLIMFPNGKLSPFGEDTIDKEGETALHQALYNGHRECAEFMMETNPYFCGIDHVTKSKDNTVIAAAFGGLYDIAKRLAVEHLVNPLVVTRDKETAATAALSNAAKATPAQVASLIDFLQFLKESGLDLHRLSGDGESLLHLGGVLALPLCRYLVDDVKLSPWAAAKDGTTPMYTAFCRARRTKDTQETMEVIRYLEEQCQLQEHPVSYETPFPDDLSNDTFLHLAVEANSIKLVEFTLQKLREAGKLAEALCLQSECSGTPLHAAAERASVEIVASLLFAGADPSPVNAEGQTCLHIIAARTDETAFDILKAFIPFAKEGTVGIFEPDNYGRTILHAALSGTHQRRLKKTKQLRKDASMPRPQGAPLPPSPEEIMEMAEDYSLVMVKYLLAHPECTIDVLRLQDKSSGWNVLHEAASNDEPATLRFLLKHLKAVVADRPDMSLADFDVQDTESGSHPIHLAATCGHFFVAKILLDTFPLCKYALDTSGKLPHQVADDSSVKDILSC